MKITGAINTPVNVNKARIRGTELALGYEHNDWRTAIALTYMDPEDRETAKQLRRLTKQTALLIWIKRSETLPLAAQ